MKTISQLKATLVLLALCHGLVYAQSAQDLYRQGTRFYDQGEYLPAAKYLFAYLRVAGTGVTQASRQQIEEAIRFSDDQVLTAIRTKQELDRHGKVTEVVIESTGKADAPNAATTRKPVPFNAPGGPQYAKPGLPPNVASTPPAALSSAVVMSTGIAVREDTTKSVARPATDCENELTELREKYRLTRRRMEALARENQRLKEQVRD